MGRRGMMTPNNGTVESETVEYFAYGANLDVAVLKRRQFEFTHRQSAVLRGFELKFNKRASRNGLPVGIGFANIVERPDSTVEGILYTVTMANLKRLDEHERAPEHYRRHRLVVETASGPRQCEVYRAHPQRVADDLVPPRNYLNHMLAAKDLVSHSYWKALSRQQCYRTACAVCAKVTEVLFVETGGASRAQCAVCGHSAT